MVAVHGKREGTFGGGFQLAAAEGGVDAVQRLHQTLLAFAVGGRDEQRLLHLVGRLEIGEDHARLFVGIPRAKEFAQQDTGPLGDLERIGRRLAQDGLGSPGILGRLFAMAVGEDKETDGAANGALFAEFGRTHGRKFGHDRVQLLQRGELPGEGARDADLLLGDRVLDPDAGGSLQFAPRAHARNAHLPLHPRLGEGHELGGGLDPHPVEHPAIAAPDAPDVTQRKGFQHFVDILPAIHPTATLQFGIAFGQPAGDFGEGLGGGDADADGDARILQDRATDAAAHRIERLIDPLQIEKGLVDGVNLERGDQLPQRGHHTPRQVAIEREIGRKECDAIAFDGGAHLKKGLSHPYSEGLGLVRAGDDAAVVVRQHDHRPTVQIGSENALAGDVEIVAVAKAEHRIPTVCSQFVCIYSRRRVSTSIVGHAPKRKGSVPPTPVET